MNDIRFSCRLCPEQFQQLKEYLRHLKHHRHVIQTYPCGIVPCPEVLPSEGCLRNHLIRRHRIRVRLLPNRDTSGLLLNALGKFVCNVSSCLQEVDTVSNLMSHLGDHIIAGCAVRCPFSPCPKQYSVFKSLRGHVFHAHKRSAIPQYEPCNDLLDHDDHYDFADNDNDNCDDNVEIAPPKLWLKTLAEFFMSLEFKYLVPRSTVQKVYCEVKSVHSDAMSSVMQVMNNDNLSHEQKRSSLLDVLRQFESGFSDLRSSHMRTEFFKKNFLYVAPQKISLGEGKFFYYVPIQETLKKMVESNCFEIDLTVPVSTGRDLYTDFYDGLLYKTNMFFRDNRKAFTIILYQDAFEICCPIGPAKNKYKMVGIYLSLGNIPAHLRTHLHAIQLVGLCLESCFDHEMVYGPIVEDLKKIETVGIDIAGHGVVKGSLIYISGDNLGSHGLGGFNENFSKSRYFCRYCLIDRPSFYAYDGHLVSFRTRNKANYNAALGKRSIEGKKGIKYNSKFNELQNFHVCDPGLPPCLGHDLLQGVASYDICIFFKYFVMTKEWFTYEQVANIMESFPYSSQDRKDKPIPLTPDHSKVPGGMWQIYNFIRLVPLMLIDLIEDPSDPVWRLFLILGEILDITCAPVIHKSYIARLQTIIVEYLDGRRTEFPDIKLRPKHHYLTHFCEIVLLLGPLGKPWTLRFEGKHGRFKDSIRASKNFKNVTLSCSIRHELYQAYIRAGGWLRCSMKSYKRSTFEVKNYNLEIQDAVKETHAVDFTQCFRCEVKGIVYSKGNILALSQMFYEIDVAFGRVLFILIENETNNVYFLVEVLESSFDHDTRMYHLGACKSYCCIAVSNLASVFPMQAYRYKMNLYVKLKYALVSKPMSY